MIHQYGGHLRELNRVSKEMRVAASGDANVLITGPTGSGKSCLARQIHEDSRRRSKPYVAVNLATLHEGTFESELFGHEKGAFTGADNRRTGRLEAANSGTVFLDEVGELPLRLQARLLELLQSRTIFPVGGNREIRLDVRVIAATNRDLAAEVARGAFRQDLFHRLRVVTMDLPSLNQRWRELDSIVHSCLENIVQTNGKKVLRISEEVARLFEQYDWPGNIRELNNILEYAVLSCEGNEIMRSDLPDWFRVGPLENSVRAMAALTQFELSESLARLDYASAMAQFERSYLYKKLEENGGRVNRTARKIGINKTTLIRRMRHYELRVAENVPVELPCIRPA